MTATPAAAEPARLSESAEGVAARTYLAAARLLRSVRRPDPTGLGNGSLSALATLARSGPMRLGDLAGCEQVAAPTMTRLVTALTEAGYAEVEPDPSDRRARLVRATESGRSIVTGRHTASIDELRRRYEGLSPQRQEVLAAALPALEELVAPVERGR